MPAQIEENYVWGWELFENYVHWLRYSPSPDQLGQENLNILEIILLGKIRDAE